MEIISNTIHYQLEQNTAVAIGKFDGIHLGHIRLLEEILDKKKEGLAACVVTFDPPPSVLFGNQNAKELMTIEEKRQVFAQMGVDILVEFPLTRQTAAMAPEIFVEQVLAKGLRAGFIAAGTDLSYGAGGKGDAELLKKLAPELGYQVKLIDKVGLDGVVISSTYVREQVEKGDMVQVNRLLGRPYRILGQVVHGNRIGRTIGMPTLNQLPGKNKLMPPGGVYFSRVYYNGRWYNGISNVGYKPTVTQERVLGVETHLYDFSEEIYGEEILLELLDYKRPERRFGSLEELAGQMREDISAGKAWHRAHSMEERQPDCQ